jgi:hypothetical protein
VQLENLSSAQLVSCLLFKSFDAKPYKCECSTERVTKMLMGVAEKARMACTPLTRSAWMPAAAAAAAVACLLLTTHLLCCLGM